MRLIIHFRSFLSDALVIAFTQHLSPWHSSAPHFLEVPGLRQVHCVWQAKHHYGSDVELRCFDFVESVHSFQGHIVMNVCVPMWISNDRNVGSQLSQ